MRCPEPHYTIMSFQLYSKIQMVQRFVIIRCSGYVASNGHVTASGYVAANGYIDHPRPGFRTGFALTPQQPIYIYIYIYIYMYVSNHLCSTPHWDGRNLGLPSSRAKEGGSSNSIAFQGTHQRSTRAKEGGSSNNIDSSLF